MPCLGAASCMRLLEKNKEICHHTAMRRILPVTLADMSYSMLPCVIPDCMSTAMLAAAWLRWNCT